LAGIYLHIPFCKQACHYCNFHFTTSLRYKDELITALCQEISLQKNYLNNEEIETIYFGGGTPSLLLIEDCQLLMETIQDQFSVVADAEITLEANPDDITIEKLQGWKKMGINRLSIGIQSFADEELQWMNRAHTSQEAIGNLQLAMTEFENITIDLIYGSPILSDEMWYRHVHKAIEYKIPHLSCYALTVEEKTPLHKHIKLQQKLPVDGDKQGHQFLLLMQWLRDAGYEHYEVSNFALPGYRSRHNSSYWKGEHYLGLGPSAHSFNGKERQWNVANNQAYITAIGLGNILAEKEVLTKANRLNEYIMISLRTIEGIDFNKIETGWGSERKNTLIKETNPYINSGLAIRTQTGVQLTDEGMLMADGIASRLFTS
jgi:oxygen-independent coproporphyrinogen-3 oxidase